MQRQTRPIHKLHLQVVKYRPLLGGVLIKAYAVDVDTGSTIGVTEMVIPTVDLDRWQEAHDAYMNAHLQDEIPF